MLMLVLYDGTDLVLGRYRQVKITQETLVYSTVLYDTVLRCIVLHHTTLRYISLISPSPLHSAYSPQYNPLHSPLPTAHFSFPTVPSSHTVPYLPLSLYLSPPGDPCP